MRYVDHVYHFFQGNEKPAVKTCQTRGGDGLFCGMCVRSRISPRFLFLPGIKFAKLLAPIPMSQPIDIYYSQYKPACFSSLFAATMITHSRLGM